MTAAALGAWALLLALLGSRAAGVPAASEAVIAAAVAAAAASAVGAVVTGARAWRGPVVIDFPQAKGAVCEPPEAEVVRGASLLRGSLGGAGYVHRKWIMFPTLAWVAAAVSAAAVIADPTTRAFPVSALVAVGSLVATAMFPARPFYYRERAGGLLVLFPAETWIRLAPPNPARRRWGDLTFRRIDPNTRAALPTLPADPVAVDELGAAAEQKRHG